MPAIRPWWSACLPSVAETCDCEISSSLIGRAPVFSRLARSCALWIVNPPAISDVVPRDPVRVLAVVDVRDRDQLVVEHGGEVLGERVGRGWPGGVPRLPALGDPARDVVPLVAPLVGERNVTSGAAAGAAEKFCSGS